MNIQFYEDSAGKKRIHPELFSKTAEKLANEIAKEGKNKSGKLVKNLRSQLRKFFDEVLEFKAMAGSEPDFKTLLPYLNMLNAKAAYAEARKLVTGKFKEFISSSLNQVKEPRDLEVFAGFFEAFMGFYRNHD